MNCNGFVIDDYKLPESVHLMPSGDDPSAARVVIDRVYWVVNPLTQRYIEATFWTLEEARQYCYDHNSPNE